MAEDSDLEKTEPASPRRLEKAREEGQVARSRELNTFLLLAAGVAVLWTSGGSMYLGLTDILRAGLWFDARVGQDAMVMLDVAAGSALRALMLLLPLFGILAVTAVLASVMLGGLLLSTKALAPKFERLNPMKGVARMFSAQTLVELIKTLLKAVVVGGVAVMVISYYIEQMVSLMHASPTEAMASGISLVAWCCALIVSGLILIVLIDAPWQLFSHFKKLRMSRQDVKQENKESDGDPHVKGRIRQQQRAMARRRMMSEVPSADVIVTNPTHYAVALSYKEGQQAAPTVVAKGSGFTAARIRALGSEHKVPMLSAPPLARALYHNVELGQEIPPVLFSAVAEVLAWVFQLRNWNMGTGAEPQRPVHLDIPPGLDPEAKEKVAAHAS